MKLLSHASRGYRSIFIIFSVGQLLLFSTYVLSIIFLDFWTISFIVYPIMMIIFTIWFITRLHKQTKKSVSYRVRLIPNFTYFELPNIDHNILYGYPPFLFDTQANQLQFHESLESYHVGIMFDVVAFDKTYACVKDSFDHYFITHTSNLEVL